MHSFIIASKNSDEGLSKAKQLSTEKSIDPIDIVVESFEKAVGIEDVRNIQKKLFLKSLRSLEKSITINAPLGLTTESQNALLKILEEPPQNTYIFLVVKSLGDILPTVISRCKIIKLEEESREIDEKEILEFKKILENLRSDNSGFKLKLAQDFGKSREEAINFLENSILTIRQILLSNTRSDLVRLVKIIEKLEEGRTAVKTSNVNPRFILENTLLAISH